LEIADSKKPHRDPQPARERMVLYLNFFHALSID
jgi:hypothetical protein